MYYWYKYYRFKVNIVFWNMFKYLFVTMICFFPLFGTKSVYFYVYYFGNYNKSLVPTHFYFTLVSVVIRQLYEAFITLLVLHKHFPKVAMTVQNGKHNICAKIQKHTPNANETEHSSSDSDHNLLMTQLQGIQITTLDGVMTNSNINTSTPMAITQTNYNNETCLSVQANIGTTTARTVESNDVQLIQTAPMWPSVNTTDVETIDKVLYE